MHLLRFNVPPQPSSQPAPKRALAGRRMLLLAGVATVALTAAACSSSSGTPTTSAAPTNSAAPGGSGAPKDDITLTVAMAPLADAAPFYIAQAKGYFAAEGIKVKIVPAPTAVGPIPSVLNNQVNVLLTTVEGTLTATSQGLGVVGVANLTDTLPSSVGDKNVGAGILVKADSPIKTVKDLVGKTVAVSGLKNYPALATTVAVDQAGGDASKIKFTEIRVPDTVTAIQQGRVDAGYVLDPFYSKGLSEGLRLVGIPVDDLFAGASNVIFIGSSSFIAQHKAAFDGFTRAIIKAEADANADPDMTRQTISEYTKVPLDKLAHVPLPKWSTSFNIDGIQKVADAMIKYKYIDKVPDLQQVFPQPAGATGGS